MVAIETGKTAFSIIVGLVARTKKMLHQKHELYGLKLPLKEIN